MDRSFLSKRRKRVILGDKVSTLSENFSGVPHGSVILPLLFDLRINYLPQILRNTT